MTAGAGETAAAPLVSFVTTCKGRLAYLRQSLPHMAAQPQAEIVVVDYDCPEGSGAWAAAAFPAARVVRVPDAPFFNAARARNLGAQAARAPWLCFIDSDVLLPGGFVPQVLPSLQEGAFFITSGADRELFGTAIVRREDFLAVEGYDEVLEGWAGEDTDLYMRLRMLGRQSRLLPGPPLDVIRHDDDTRVRYHQVKDARMGQRINALYAQAKHDLARQFGRLNLPVEMRRTVYAEAKRAMERALESGGPVRLEVVLPGDLSVRLYGGWTLRRVWHYVMEPPAQPPPGPGRATSSADS